MLYIRHLIWDNWNLAHIARHEADERLAESRQFDAYHRLTAFIMHDLKNLIAQLSLLVGNAEKHKANPEFALACLKAAHHAGARWVVLCDTNGGTLPHEVSRIVTQVCGQVPRRRDRSQKRRHI